MRDFAKFSVRLMAAAGTAMSALALAAAAPAAAQQRCPSEGGLRSQHGAVATTINFINQSAQTIQIWWLNYQGRREGFATLRPGQRYEAWTYATHPWVVTDESGNCLQIVFAERDMTYTHR